MDVERELRFIEEAILDIRRELAVLESKNKEITIILNTRVKPVVDAVELYQSVRNDIGVNDDIDIGYS